MTYTPRATPRGANTGQPVKEYMYPVRPNSRPDTVPPLNLDMFGRNDSGTTTDYKLKEAMCSAHSDATSISWGTPSSACKKMAAIQDGLRLDLPEEVSEKAMVASEPPAAVNEQFPESMTERATKLETAIPRFAASARETSKTTPLTPAQVANAKKLDKESLQEENQRLKILETVMIDQLSRPVISDPAQDELQVNTPSYHVGSKRGTLRDSRIRTAGTPTENLLAKKVQFGARLLSRNNRDAIRELTGFFFSVDNSVTIYEFRQLGKSSKALPFIKRGVYQHLSGLKTGQSYTVVDIKQGSTLHFKWVDQPCPDTVKGNETVIIKVTTVDNSAKALILFDGVPVQDRDDVWRRAHLPTTQEEYQATLLQRDVQRIVRSQMKKRAVKAYTGIGRELRKLAAEARDNGKLNKFELEKVLVDFHISVPDQKFDDLWETVDVTSSSFLVYDEFMRTYLGQMNEDRKMLVRRAFAKVDSSKKGVVTLEGMTKFYNTHSHPKVKSGELNEQQVISAFFSAFQDQRSMPSGRTYDAMLEVTFAEFEEFYEGVSISIENDDEFCNLVRSEWGI